MQDDKDDGAQWLVEQGLVDKDRIAIFGYSYGGYAAMVAIVRPDTPYQCAISGAGLSDLRYFDKVTFEGAFGREFQNPTIKGLSPLDLAKDASIPIYIFHGDRDHLCTDLCRAQEEIRSRCPETARTDPAPETMYPSSRATATMELPGSSAQSGRYRLRRTTIYTKSATALA